MAMAFRAYVVRKDKQGHVHGALEHCQEQPLPEGYLRIAVQYSAVNYKDVLSAGGHPGVSRTFPHLPAHTGDRRRRDRVGKSGPAV